MKKTAKNIKEILVPKVNLSKIKLSLPGSNTKRKNAKPARRQDVKLHQHLLERFNARKEKRLRMKAEYMATLPKGRQSETALDPREKVIFVPFVSRVIAHQPLEWPLAPTSRNLVLVFGPPATPFDALLQPGLNQNRTVPLRKLRFAKAFISV